MEYFSEKFYKPLINRNDKFDFLDCYGVGEYMHQHLVLLRSKRENWSSFLHFAKSIVIEPNIVPIRNLEFSEILEFFHEYCLEDQGKKFTCAKVFPETIKGNALIVDDSTIKVFAWDDKKHFYCYEWGLFD